MPLLNLRRRQESASADNHNITESLPVVEVHSGTGLTTRCSNPGCRSGWLKLFRNRTRPGFEGGWTCSPECTEARLRVAVHRELDGWVRSPELYRHRIPLGLLMLERGWITSQQLRHAVETQRRSGNLRIGDLLVKQGAATEELVTRALSLQWGCPVLSLSNTGLTVASELLPRLFVDAFGVVPLKDASGRTLYLGFEQAVDKALTFSVQQMTGTRVESGIVQSSTFRKLHSEIPSQGKAGMQMAEAATDSAAAHLLAKSIERERPFSSRLVRVHEWLWLRMIVKPQNAPPAEATCIRDVICRIGPL